MNIRPLLIAHTQPAKSLSDAERKAANDWIDNTLRSRLNDPAGGAIVLIMQRLGEVLSLLGWGPEELWASSRAA